VTLSILGTLPGLPVSRPDIGSAVPPWKREVPAASPDVIRTLRRELVEYARRRLGASDASCDAIALATSEALTNAVQHAYVGERHGPITIEARLEGANTMLVRVCDEGRGPLPRADSPGLGLGLGVMAQVADEFSISTRQDRPGTVVTLRFSLRNGDPNSSEAAAPGTNEPAIQI
jgi:stage II sporulation protein AB (anti-sigma F factor)